MPGPTYWGQQKGVEVPARGVVKTQTPEHEGPVDINGVRTSFETVEWVRIQGKFQHGTFYLVCSVEEALALYHSLGGSLRMAGRA